MPNNDEYNSVKVRYEEELDAMNERRVPRSEHIRSETNARIRSVVGDYRVVVPDGAQKGRRFFTNNSSLVIEKRSKDATGAEKWDRVMSFSKPKPGDKIDSEMIDLHSLYWLLAGPDAE